MMLSNEQKDSFITSLERIACGLADIALFCDWMKHNGIDVYNRIVNTTDHTDGVDGLIDAVQKIADALTTDKK